MISPEAVQKFLEKPSRNFDLYKKLPYDDLLNVLEKTGLTFDTLKPRLHQLVAIYLSLKLKQFLLFLPTGTGKSFIMLQVMRYLKMHHKAKRTLILVPNVIAVPNWKAEFHKIAPELEVVGLEGSSAKKWKTLEKHDADAYITNYAGLVSMCSVMVPDPKKKPKQRSDNVQKGEGLLAFTRRTLGEDGDWRVIADLNNLRVNLDSNRELKVHKWRTGMVLRLPPKPRMRLVLDRGLIARMGELFDCVIYDESTSLKNPKSLTFKLCQHFKDTVPYRYGLTGTPFGRDPSDLWAQFYVIDGGESLGYTWWFFMNTFFSQNKGFWGGIEWKFQKRRKKYLHQKVGNRSLTYQLEECIDIPAKTVIPIRVPMPEYLKPYYNKLKDQLRQIAIESQKNLLPNKNVFLSARQMTSGFLTLREKGTGAKEVMHLPDNIKLQATEMLLDELDSEKMVIFHDFNASGDMLEKLLKEKGIGYARVYGETKNREKELLRFQKDPACQVFVLNSFVGQTALNLQIAPYMLFYESPTGSIARRQCEARVYRMGQRQKTFIYDLIVEDTVDEKIQSFLAEGKDLYHEIMVGNVEVKDVI